MEWKKWIDKGCDILVPDAAEEWGKQAVLKIADTAEDLGEAVARTDAFDAGVNFLKKVEQAGTRSGSFGNLRYFESLADPGIVMNKMREDSENAGVAALLMTFPQAGGAVRAVTAISGLETLGKGVTRLVALKKVQGAYVALRKTEDREVFSSDELNQLLAENENEKISNLRLTLANGRAVIKGDYAWMLGSVEFTLTLDIAIREGKVTGGVRSVEAIGMDLKDVLAERIMGHFEKNGIEVPPGATLDDLSWLKIPGIKSLEIGPDLVLVERDAPELE